MIDLSIRVVFNGEKIDVTDTKASDLVALERHFSVSIPRLRDLTFEQACFLVWRDLRRNGTIPADAVFGDEFLDQIDDMEQIEDPFEGPAGTASP